MRSGDRRTCIYVLFAGQVIGCHDDQVPSIWSNDSNSKGLPLHKNKSQEGEAQVEK